MLLSPGVEGAQNGGETSPFFAQSIFHMRRNFWVDFPNDKLVFFELTK